MRIYFFLIILLGVIICFSIMIIFVKKITDRIIRKRKELELKEKYDQSAKLKLEKNLRKRYKIIMHSLKAMFIIRVILLLLFIVRSYYDIKDIIRVYKEYQSLFLLINLKSAVIPILTVVYLIVIVRDVLDKKAEDVT